MNNTAANERGKPVMKEDLFSCLLQNVDEAARPRTLEPTFWKPTAANGVYLLLA